MDSTCLPTYLQNNTSCTRVPMLNIVMFKFWDGDGQTLQNKHRGLATRQLFFPRGPTLVEISYTLGEIPRLEIFAEIQKSYVKSQSGIFEFPYFNTVNFCFLVMGWSLGVAYPIDHKSRLSVMHVMDLCLRPIDDTCTVCNLELLSACVRLYINPEVAFACHTASIF